MFIGVLLGGMLSIGKIGEYSETEAGHWLEVEHIFINNIGFISFIIMGLVYFVVPSISKKEIYSKELAKFDFIILNLGLFLMVFGIAVKALLFWSLSSVIIMIGGIVLTLGFFIFGYNILRSF